MERTPEDRERARREREARRRGEPLPPPPAPPTPAAPPPTPESNPAPAETRAPEPSAPAAGPARTPGREGPPPAPPPRRARADAVLARTASRRGAVPAPPPPREPRPRRGLLLPAATIATPIAAVALWFLNALYQPLAGDGGERVRVTIPRGDSVGRMAERLAAVGVVDRPFFFRLRARLAGRSEDLKPGSYVLRRDMAYAEILDALAKGPARRVVHITIPEGRARAEIAPLVRRAGLRGSYLRASARSPELDPRRYGARTRGLEGFLFPATYELRRGASAADLVERQLRAFRRALRAVDLSYARSKNLTVHDVVTIASMVEREAQVARERRLIAAVIYNRMREGIPLGIDATIRYATRNWTRPLRQSELASDTPYNTRRRQGLPPGPIGNPGLASLRAAARPARVGYLYYVVKPGTCGEHAFSSTDAQFQRDQAAYHRAREARGGRSPTTC